jgi:hypothetical protein
MFRIGMKVVCVTTHEQNEYKKGMIYNVLGVREITCRCAKRIVIDIGIRINGGGSYCMKCFHHLPPDGIIWCTVVDFRPIQDQYTEAEIEAVNIDEITKEVEYA